MIANNTPADSIHFRVKRQDSPTTEPYWQHFAIPYKPNLNIISVLQYIAGAPVTTEGQNTTPVVWDCSCLEEVCGACTQVINGRARQACSTLVDELREQGFGNADNPIVLEPMSKFPVVRDLFVDRSRMFKNLIKLQGWVPIDGSHSLGAGPTEPPLAQEERYELSRCMTCGCCLEACPQFTLENNFVGAQAIGQALYFNQHATGAKLKDERLEVMAAAGGINDCGNAQNCVKACPKEIPLTEAIAKIGRQTTLYAFRKFFTSK